MRTRRTVVEFFSDLALPRCRVLAGRAYRLTVRLAGARQAASARAVARWNYRRPGWSTSYLVLALSGFAVLREFGLARAVLAVLWVLQGAGDRSCSTQGGSTNILAVDGTERAG